jgi:hypothetical protein
LSVPVTSPITLYYNNQILPKKVSADSKILTVTIPAGASSGYFELKLDGQVVKASEQFIVTGPTDIQPTDLYPDTQPVGIMYAKIINNGPGTLINNKVSVSVSGTQQDLSGASSASFITPPADYTLNIAPGQTQTINLNINIDTSKYKYSFSITVTAVDFTDPKSDNNTYMESIGP